ncbi:MAG: hypothetical protein ACR2MX_04525 [Cyclobacteriaceae bacterium]
MGRICKNSITDLIRDQFGANPLRVPEARIQPMCMLEIHKNQQQYLGEFKYLVKGGFNHDIAPKEAPVSEVSNKRSKAVDFKTGFGILSGFLKALKIDPASVTASLTKSKKMAFSFSNVKRKYIDPLMLGSLLSGDGLFGDVDNFVLQPAIQDKKIKLGLITDVIVSNNFSLSALSESDTAVNIDVPMLADAISKLNLGVKVNKQTDNEVQFEGSENLTFAFSCLELTIDPATGKFGRGKWLEDIKDASGKPRSVESLQPGEEHLLEKIMMDENEEYPLLIEL